MINKIYVSDGGELNASKIESKRFWILLDNGHARSTKGKRSPVLEDGRQLFEYKFNRDIVRRITTMLDKEGISYIIITPEIDYDVPLLVRASRVNQYCNKFGKDNCLLISIHANAMGDGSTWNSCRGWSVWTTKGKTKSDKYADILFKEAKKILPSYGMTLKSDLSDGDYDFEDNFTIIYKTKCPAVLTENLFMTNKKDCEFLLSDEGRDVIAQIHVNAIKQIINENKES